MLESEIRDMLAEQLSAVFPGLELLAKEKYIPSKMGTRSFIDLLAKDAIGLWVLIELKRSDAAAREAIHEANKYAEAVKAHFGARDDEIRVVIVSTEWRELIQPFSRFKADTTIEVSGYLLNVDNLKALKATAVEALRVSSGRVLAPWHELNLYKDVVNLEKGIASYQSCCKKKGLSDFLLIVLRAHDDFAHAAREATRQSLRNIHMQFDNRVDESEIDRLLARMDDYEYILYFVPQMLTKEECFRLLQTDPEALREAKDISLSFDGEEELLYLHESVFAAKPRPYRDRIEIGNAAKFKCKLLEEERWSIQDVKRYGAFARNELLQNSTLIEEVSGSTGTSGQRYKRTINLSNTTQYEMAKHEIETCLENNPMWSADILVALEECRSNHADKSVEINIYNPTAGVFTLFFAATRQDGILNLPAYGLNIVSSTPQVGYFGELTAAEKPCDLSYIVSKYYGGDLGALLLVATFGFYEPRDAEILEDLGLLYTSYKIDKTSPQEKFFKRKNARWKPTKAFKPFEAMAVYIQNNEKLIRQVVGKIGPRFSGGMIDASPAVLRLDGLVDEQRAIDKEIIYIDPPTECNLCWTSFAQEKYMIDGMLKNGMWAMMCADCFMSSGTAIAWGAGQLYRQRDDGSFALVAGFAPDEGDEDEADFE